MFVSSIASAQQMQLLRTATPFIEGAYSQRLLLLSPAMSNPSFFVQRKGFAAAIEIEQTFLLNEARLFSAIAVHSFEKMMTGILVSHSGFEGYSQSSVTLLLGRQLGNVQLASEFSFYHSMTAGYGKAGSMNAGLSCRMQLSPSFTTGIRLRNMGGLLFRNEKLIAPVIMAGAGYDASEAVHFGCVWMQDGGGSPVITTGLLYRFHPSLVLTFGTTFFPCQPYGGFQFQRSDWKLHFKTSFHPLLGWSPSLGIAFGNIETSHQ